MDKGSGDKYKGKSLNEIDINPNTEYAEINESEEDDSDIDAIITESKKNDKIPNVPDNMRERASTSNGVNKKSKLDIELQNGNRKGMHCF